MSQQDRIAEIEDLTIHEFKTEIHRAIENLQKGNKPGNTIELLAAALNIGLLGEDLKTSLERWLQLDLWHTVDNK
ncbi:MAG: hypothetical protein JXB48_09295 [Candidatus Latescibacteria bacterium]|nr:hypothetical protein [Candidatus Latescibacterota bacterium]